ncbi:hypothetical protein SAMD00023353_4500740 [Rosellinia necatrix]|uniref:Uncharacterized protein n=1 Tax=Rosellinia necatrix TaxID=77044 RepID=A0A1S8A9G5_ROSNE|nr:hypothetical protein SAMD00023353_4500740 [Rosellinia necatrix]
MASLSNWYEPSQRTHGEAGDRSNTDNVDDGTDDDTDDDTDEDTDEDTDDGTDDDSNNDIHDRRSFLQWRWF